MGYVYTNTSIQVKNLAKNKKEKKKTLLLPETISM